MKNNLLIAILVLGTFAFGCTTAPSAQSASSGVTFSNVTFTNLLLSGSPTQCSVSYARGKKSIALNMFFDGNGSIRVEEPNTGSSDCPSALLIYKGDIANGGTFYLSCPGNNAILGTDFMHGNAPCDWDSMDVSAKYGSIGNAMMGFGSYGSPALGGAAASDYICQPWTSDSSKFTVAGHVCS